MEELLLAFNNLSLPERKQYKICTHCYCFKHLDEFSKRKRQGKMGKHAHCIECGKKYKI